MQTKRSLLPRTIACLMKLKKGSPTDAQEKPSLPVSDPLMTIFLKTKKFIRSAKPQSFVAKPSKVDAVSSRKVQRGFDLDHERSLGLDGSETVFSGRSENPTARQ